MDIWMTLQEPWAMRALIASSMVGISCGVLGCFIVLRNMALIGDALSHAVLPGVFFAFLIFGYSVIGFFIGSVTAGLLAAVAITWIQQNVKTKNDAAIGIVFTAMFAIGVMGISWISKSEGVHLDIKDFLVGNVLGVTDEDMYLTGGLTIYVIINVIIFYRHLFVSTFQPTIAETMGISVQLMHYFLMLLLSFVVVAALQTVGVILVVAMLITPASTALLLTDRLNKVIILAAVLGLVSAVAGLFLAIVFDTTPGPAMAVVAAFMYVLSVFFSPQKGLVFQYFQKRNLKSKIHLEDVIKESFKLENKNSLTFDLLRDKLGFKNSKLKKLIKQLQKSNLFEKNKLALTKTGRETASKLTRAHRLWETYLVNEIGLKGDQIHDDAERLEHHLTEDLLDEVDAHLGFPRHDPHGSPIPSKTGLPLLSLSQIELGKAAMIAAHELNERISSMLWKLGVLPHAPLKIARKTKDVVQIEQSGKTIEIPAKLAAQIAVHNN